MKFASITSAIALMVVATSALPHGGHTYIGGSNGLEYNGGLGNGIAKGGVLANNSKKSSTTVERIHHRRSYGGDNHGHGHSYGHGHGTVVVGGSNDVAYNGGAANGLLAGGVLSDNSEVSTNTIYTHHNKRNGHNVYVEGSNGKQFNGGLLNGVAEGGIAADNSRKSSTNVVDVHHRRSYGGYDHDHDDHHRDHDDDHDHDHDDHHDHGHEHDRDNDHDHGHGDGFKKVLVGGSNDVAYNRGAANGLLAGGALSDNSEVSTNTIYTHHDKGNGHDVYVKGNNGKQFNNGLLNGAAEGGVLSNNKKEASTSIVIDKH